jgi:hypothetical protein
MRNQLVSLAAFVMMSACGVLAAQNQPGAETYQWSGEFVSFDETTGTATIKARLVDQEGVTDLKRFKAGERVNLLWSGFDKYADAIRRVMPYSANRKDDERFQLPVELVSTEAPHQYVTFRLTVPTTHVAALKSVKPGEWVTVTSSHRPSGESDATVSIRPYVTVSAATSE